MSSDSKLHPDAKESLDRYLSERKQRLNRELREINELAGRRWWKLIIANFAIILTGAVAVLRVAASAAESAAVETVNSTEGVVSSLVADLIIRINEKLASASTALGKVEAVKDTLDAQALLALQDLKDSRVRLAQEADRLQREFVSQTKQRLGELRSKFEAGTQAGVAEIQAQQAKLQATAESIETLSLMIQRLNEVAGSDLESKVRQWTTVASSILDNARGVETLVAHGQDIDELKARTEDFVDVLVPIGGVIAWWGTVEDIPEDFELCDGESPGAGATLAGRKPDLRGRFVAGWSAGDLHTEDLGSGGTDRIDGLVTEEVQLTIAQLPPHAHDVSDPGHSHDVVDKGHSHRLPMGDGDGGDRNRCADGDSNERRRVDSGNSKTGIAVSSAPTGIQVLATGEGEGHQHGLPSIENRPAFQELFYIIRVR